MMVFDHDRAVLCWPILWNSSVVDDRYKRGGVLPHQLNTYIFSSHGVSAVHARAVTNDVHASMM